MVGGMLNQAPFVTVINPPVVLNAYTHVGVTGRKLSLIQLAPPSAMLGTYSPRVGVLTAHI